MDESTNHRDLLQLVEGTLYAGGEDLDCAAFLAVLQHAKPAFLNLLRYKVLDAGLLMPSCCPAESSAV